MRFIGPVIIVAALSACVGPTTVLQHPDTKQAVACQSFGLGAGESHDACVEQLQALGFVGPEEGSTSTPVHYSPIFLNAYPPA